MTNFIVSNSNNYWNCEGDYNIKGNIQLSPEGEMNSGGYTKMQIYQISWVKLKKELFVN